MGAALAAVAFTAQSGQTVDQATWPEIATVIVGAAVAALAVVRGGGARRAWGVWSLAALAAFAALTAVSISWAVQPDAAWRDTSLTLAYLAAFGGGLALVRLVPGRWETLLSGVLLAALAVGGYAVLTKVVPESLAADEIASRLRAPFGYWNATGLMAGLGIPACLWLGTRRHGHQALTALAYPALTLLLVAVLLSYSRGALVAVVFGGAFWFATVDRRLRGAAVLLVSGAGAALVSLWAFSRDALTQTQVDVGARAHEGHRLGVLLVVVLVLMLAAGLAVSFWAEQRPLAGLWRRRVALALIVLTALVPVAALGAVQSSNGGISGQWHRLTDVHSTQPPNSPSRLTALGSVRARYFHEALQVFGSQKWHGVGADGFGLARKHYSIDALSVQHAHSFVFQTLADFGLIGLALTLALLAAWLTAAARPLGLRHRHRAATPERAGMLTLGATVLVFGVSSMIDWTWFIPGTAVLALVCAGWLAGRGPLSEALSGARWRPDPLRIGAACAIGACALVVGYTILQPLRSVHSDNAALAALDRGDIPAAQAAALRAHDQDRLAVDPLFNLALVAEAGNRPAAASAALEQAVRLQPRNPDTWSHLGEHLLNDLGNAKAAVGPLGAAVYLDPNGLSGQRQAEFVQARQAAGQP
ncbi:MAG: Tetratricopeptide 2 repeat protein [Solirubrobacterales bacterium]|nr:Tetratricopeptide 2 repeat protein [Solirubrobacterales bacterium]